MNLFDNLTGGSGDNPLAMLLRQLLGGGDQQQPMSQLPQQTSAIPTHRPDIQAKVQMQSQGPVGGAARTTPTPTDASAFDVYQGRASSGRASNGDIIRRMPDGQIQRQSARYGYSEPVQGQGERSGGINRMFPGTTGRNSAGAVTASGGQDALMDNGQPSQAGQQRQSPFDQDGMSPIGNFLWKTFDPGGYAENKTVSWLKQNGLSEGDAIMVANNRDMLNAFMTKNVGSRVFGPEPAKRSIQTIYDHAGNEQKVWFDEGSGAYTPLGGTKSSILSPDEEAQKIRLANAGRSQINNNMPGQTTETAYDKEVGTSYAKRFVDFQDRANVASRGLSTIASMRTAMADPNFYSGTAAGAVEFGKRLAASLGLGDVSSMEQFNALSKQSALDAMGGSLGSGFSNADRDFVTGQVANLGNTPEGNRALLDIQEKMLKRTQEIGRLANDYARRNNGRIDAGFDSFLSEWSEKNPLFPPQQPWYRRDDQGPTRIRNPEQPAQKWRATNPQTGEAIEWDGNAWVKAR